LTILNLTNETIDFTNSWGPPVKFWGRGRPTSLSVKDKKNIVPLLNGQELGEYHNLVLLPKEMITINGLTHFQEPNIYTISALVYEPHYDSGAYLEVLLGYGKKTDKVQAKMSRTV